MRKFRPEPDLASSLLCHTNVDDPKNLDTEGLEKGKNYAPSSLEAIETEKCETCGESLATDETPTDHVRSIQATSKGLCDICSVDWEDVLSNVKMNLKNCKDPVDRPPMVIITECLDIYDNKNYTDFTSSDFVVKEANSAGVSEILKNL